MLTPAGKVPGGVRAVLRGCLFAALLAIPAMAQAQSFMLPQHCRQRGASGSEGDDPVVILVDNSTAKPVTSFKLVQISGPPTIEWGITISPFTGGQAGYSVFTSYTPFLTSTTMVSDPSTLPSKNLTLPRPGVVVYGRTTVVWDYVTVTIKDKSQSQAVPNAYVDFIPDFEGSSPLTLQANSSGQITLLCVQQNFQGYNMTVYDQNHNYLYDGSIDASGQGLSATVEGSIETVSRPHPDEPE